MNSCMILLVTAFLIVSYNYCDASDPNMNRDELRREERARIRDQDWDRTSNSTVAVGRMTRVEQKPIEEVFPGPKVQGSRPEKVKGCNNGTGVLLQVKRGCGGSCWRMGMKRNTTYTGQMRVHTRQPRPDGRRCRFSGDCASGCCLIRKRNKRICSARATIGQSCGVGQVKGGAYPDYCPCSKGNVACVEDIVSRKAVCKS